MTDRRVSLDTHELISLVTECIRDGGSFTFYPKGISMLPMIAEGDCVTLEEPHALGKNDIVLYMSGAGVLTLHRIVRMKGDMLDICGDNQFYPERGVSTDRIIAKVTALTKRGVRATLSDMASERTYVRYLRRLHTLRPIRRLLRRLLP